MPENSNQQEKSSEMELALTKQTETDKLMILEKAKKIAKSEGRENIELPDIAQAYLEYKGNENKKHFLQPWIESMLSPITGVTLICTILTIVFGYFGLNNNIDPGLRNGFLDIAKIFAGAVVGSGIVSIQRNNKN